MELHRDESQIVLPRLLSEGRSFDFAFVDGNHRFDGVFLDLVYLGRLVRPGGVVFLDDFGLPAIARAVSFFLTNRGWTLEDAARDELHEWAVLRTGTEDNGSNPSEQPSASAARVASAALATPRRRSLDRITQSERHGHSGA